MARILITGSNGQVGSCLTSQLKKVDVEVLAVDFEQLDITDRNAIIDVVSEFKPNVIINAAAYTAVDRAEIEAKLAHAINTSGAKFLAQAAESVGAAMFHISTDYVFSGNASQEYFYVEDDDVAPQGVYGKTKLEGELEVSEQCSNYIILRTAWVFGEVGNNFVKTMIRLGRDRKTLGVVADQFGGPTFAGDIAAVLIKIAMGFIETKQLKSGIYHYTGMPCVSWFEFAQAIFEFADIKGVIQNRPQLNALSTNQYPTPAKRPANSKLSLKKINDVFDVKPSDWRKALERIEYYRD